MQRPPAQDPPGDEVPTVALGEDVVSAFSSGTIIGQRYRIDNFLGRGGMGEVWQAFDLKLRVDVALKSLHRERFPEEKALEMLRREARSAREVVSPNVCRIFDLVEIEGQELVSMEYIDGTTLLSVLKERGPLEPREATEIAAQFLAGLEAIHRAGLVHRDVKPENIMITRSGRVVLMDFGLAKPQADAGPGRVSGTPAYMSPEQMRGDGLDARTDIFAAGVVLAEMIHAKGIRERASRETLHRGLHQDPPEIPRSPWRPVLLRAVAPDPEDRYPSARELVRALEEVALRVDGTDVLRPYPGLASFTEADAEYFFGREVEVETVWKKLRRPHLLGLIGPSGAGKTSFLHAGLLPAMPEGWRCIVCQPGDAAMQALARALVPELAGDPDAMDESARFEDPDVAVSLFTGWRQRHEETLLVVDQFEELFTLNPPEAQTRFAELIGRLPVEADVHVLLSMRDDFLFRCHEQPALGPLFSELTPLGAPTGAALRRALVQPALKCGHRFEDNALVDEMLDEVAEERGALPLLAFAVARLWEERDRESGSLTREAYSRIGGVGGALAQHAESTLERIGAARVSIVREVFRNLVTSQGTRAARDVGELLSVFEDREPAREVLRALIDARLLTSFEVCPEEGDTEPRRRIEIIHESLLTAWPRLVRWCTQDADSARLRDQLRQAARTWNERGRPADLLWSGTAFRECQVWRERYPGGLTATEQAFVRAMVVQAGRRRRRRRALVAASFVVLLGVLAVVLGLLRQSRIEARRAGAARLIAAGRLEAEYRGHNELRGWSVSGPSVALAYALASLELADTDEGRLFALETLWLAPPGFFLPDPPGESPAHVAFSPDGQWLAVSYHSGGPVKLWSADGGDPIHLLSGGRPDEETADPVVFGPDSRTLVTFHRGRTFRVWSVPDGDLLRTLSFDDWTQGVVVAGGRLITGSQPTSGEAGPCWQSWPLVGGEPTSLGCLQTTEERSHVDPTGTWLLYNQGGPDLFVVPLDDIEGTAPRLVGRHEDRILLFEFNATGERLAAMDLSGGLSIWSIDGEPDAPLASFRGEGETANVWLDRTGSMAATGQREVHLWDLAAPPDADPVQIARTLNQMASMAFHPEGTWLAFAAREGVSVIPLGYRRPQVLRLHERLVTDLSFLPDGDSIVSGSLDRTVRLSPLAADKGEGTTSVWEQEVRGVAADPDRRFLVAAAGFEGQWLLPLDDTPPRRLPGLRFALTAAVSPDGRLVAGTGANNEDTEGAALRVFDLESDDMRVLEEFEFGTIVHDLQFISEHELLSSNQGRLTLWDLESGDSQVVVDEDAGRFDVGRGARRLVTCPFDALEGGGTTAVFHDLDDGTSRSLTSHGADVTAVALDSGGEVAVTAGIDGIVRAGPVTGEPPHLMFGHVAQAFSVAVSPDRQWIASGGEDGTVRLWPMPDGQPLHTLPYDELLDRLRALTNIRAVEDETSSTGYRLEIERFPGWESTPEW
jgi:WD40 repeat protein